MGETARPAPGQTMIHAVAMIALGVGLTSAASAQTGDMPPVLVPRAPTALEDVPKPPPPAVRPKVPRTPPMGSARTAIEDVPPPPAPPSVRTNTPRAPSTESARPTKSLEGMYFDGPNPVLTPRERKGLAIEGQWSGTSLSTRDLPAPGADGMIRYVYGTVQASVVCAVLQICDVELQPGETIKGVDIGDSARWVVNVTAAGEPPNVTEHLILKPTDVGLTTSMVITTNRRVYHLLLRSHRTQTMVRVGWTYPEDLNKRIAERRRQLDAQRIEQTLPATNEYLGDLSFAYRVTGEAPWKPIRVYNDGAKTIIQLSKEVQASEAPTLLVLRSEGNLFQKEEVAVVNYRLQRDRYIVDQVFDRAVLIAGVGGSQTRVTIEREVQR